MLAKRYHLVFEVLSDSQFGVGFENGDDCLCGPLLIPMLHFGGEAFKFKLELCLDL